MWHTTGMLETDSTTRKKEFRKKKAVDKASKDWIRGVTKVGKQVQKLRGLGKSVQGNRGKHMLGINH
jgi:hypothetical protein